MSTPKKDGSFNVYDDIRDKLIAEGVPADEIAYIHDANTIARKNKLFAKVRKGTVRFLLGSTAKMGAGTNVQDRLIALHHLILSIQVYTFFSRILDLMQAPVRKHSIAAA